ncbi:MAG: glycosyltransferase family 2 protein, partial [Candidatus Hodarchaeota archaeon]
SVVLDTKRYVDKVIVIDDGSKDKTAKIARLAGAEVIQHIQNGGKGSALKTGFMVAEKLKPDVVVCLDADAQHNPDFIPKVIAPVLSGEADMVIASRYVDKKSLKPVPKYKRFGLWVLSKALNLGSKCKISDTQCGFRAFSGDILGKFRFQQNGLSIESEMIEDATENNIKIKEVSFMPKYNGSDTPSEKPGKHGLRVLSFIIKTIKDRHPLLFFGVTGVILLIIGLGFGVYSFDWYFKYHSLPFGASLAASVLILMGALSIFAGLILNSISGMIRGVSLLNHRQGETYEKNFRRLPTLNHDRKETLLGDVNGHNIQGITALSNIQKDILLGEINGQKSQVISILSNYPVGIPFRDINGQKINGVTQLNNHPIGIQIRDINGQKFQGVTVLNNRRVEISLEDIEEQKTQI